MSPGEAYREWAAGWRKAAEDDARHIRQTRGGSPETRRGYGDYWEHKADHPKRHEDWNIILDVPAATRQAAGLVLPEPEQGWNF